MLIRRDVLLPTEQGYWGQSVCECPPPSVHHLRCSEGTRGYARFYLTFTCWGLAVPPVKVAGVDTWLQRASDRVSPSLNVGLKEVSIQLSHSVHAHLQYMDVTMETSSHFHLGGRLKITRNLQFLWIWFTLRLLSIKEIETKKTH